MGGTGSAKAQIRNIFMSDLKMAAVNYYEKKLLICWLHGVVSK